MALPSLVHKPVQAAIPVMIETLNSTTESSQGGPEFHIHLFSNGGSRLLAALYQGYAERVSSSPLLPEHNTIFDSAPSIRYDHSQIALSILAGILPGLLRTLFLLIVHLLSQFFLFGICLLGYSDPIAQWAASQNDTNIVLERRRVYIYSGVDAFVSQADVERHASDAVRKGFDFRRELFTESPHVTHAKPERKRYWSIVQDMWKNPMLFPDGHG